MVNTPHRTKQQTQSQSALRARRTPKHKAADNTKNNVRRKLARINNKIDVLQQQVADMSSNDNMTSRERTKMLQLEQKLADAKNKKDDLEKEKAEAEKVLAIVRTAENISSRAVASAHIAKEFAVAAAAVGNADVAEAAADAAKAAKTAANKAVQFASNPND